jgi:hypothetical protein
MDDKHHLRWARRTAVSKRGAKGVVGCCYRCLTEDDGPEWLPWGILAFTGYENVVMRGFNALEAMPDYYKTAVGVVFAASFGIQSVTNIFKK